jgi:hypothetical protein
MERSKAGGAGGILSSAVGLDTHSNDIVSCAAHKANADTRIFGDQG